MTAPEVELRRCWLHLAGGHPQPDEGLEGLLLRLGEPHRRYHTAAHVMWVLRRIDEFVRGGEGAGCDLDAVRLAALFHDAVYDPTRTDNEALSAELAVRRAMAWGWPGDRCEAARGLVLATIGHEPRDAAAAVLVDADLAVLGSEPNDYLAYTRGVRAEYAHVDDGAWRAGRAQVLRRFLDMPTIFHTKVGRARLEARARANLTAELAGLSG